MDKKCRKCPALEACKEYLAELRAERRDSLHPGEISLLETHIGMFERAIKKVRKE